MRSKPTRRRALFHSAQVTAVFQMPVQTRFAIVDRLLAFGDQPPRFPDGIDLCRERVCGASADIDALRFAAQASNSGSPHAFKPLFSPADWHTFSSFCIARRLPKGFRVLIPGRADRTLRFVVEGSLAQAAVDAGRPTLLPAGSVLGEDAFFWDVPGEYDVRTLEDSLVLELSLARQRELTAACPAIAFELLRAAGAVIAARGRATERRAELATN